MPICIISEIHSDLLIEILHFCVILLTPVSFKALTRGVSLDLVMKFGVKKLDILRYLAV